ncbi:AMIN domain-containing protein [Rosenbergiella gaditana]|uniref:AMIN domain-containing protein n=1 Tax=Rosenbergiella gaditana TaxID=2726987 RepID=UPI0020259E6D|nr:AMIN domain-containing protein [Rosenbergiella gaditana]
MAFYALYPPDFRVGNLTPLPLFYFEVAARLVIDINDFRLSPVLHKLSQQVKRADPFIRGIRVAKFDVKTLRVVIDLKQPVRQDIFYLYPVANFQHRLLVMQVSVLCAFLVIT